VTDPYVRKARAQGYRSRAAFKLIEVNSRERLLIPGFRVADLGAAPGGWSQVAAEKVGPRGKVIAIDLLAIAPLPGVVVLQGDFRDPAWQAQMAAGGKFDVVLSDLSPNLSGIAATDQARAAELVRMALEFSREYLKAEGSFLAKIFQGAEFEAVLGEMRQAFHKVRVLKPAASRDESRETYLLARHLKH
jgi:23S rRNA (uridine2552-2'-O)-methyltransferase